MMQVVKKKKQRNISMSHGKGKEERNRRKEREEVTTPFARSTPGARATGLSLLRIGE